MTSLLLAACLSAFGARLFGKAKHPPLGPNSGKFKNVLWDLGKLLLFFPLLKTRVLPLRCGAGRPQEDRSHPGLAPPPEGEGIRGWALLEGAETGEAPRLLNAFGKLLEVHSQHCCGRQSGEREEKNRAHCMRGAGQVQGNYAFFRTGLFPSVY